MNDVLKTFLKNYEKDLIQISITERHQKGLGIMFMNIEDEEMKCGFISIGESQIPSNIRDEVIEMNKKKNSDIYLYFNDKDNSQLITIDLDKRNQ